MSIRSLRGFAGVKGICGKGRYDAAR